MNNIYDNDTFFNEYARMDRSEKGLPGAGEWHQFQKMFPELKDKRVLDLGCGYGWHCQYALDCGASGVTGIDGSEKMIQEAIRRDSAGKVDYRVCGLEDYDYPPETYDCVISNLVLHYIPDLNLIYKKVYSTLKNGGEFLLNMEHPVFTAGVCQEWVKDENGKNKYWPVDDYFYPGERVTHFLGQRVSKQHHTLTQILMGLIESGFQIKAVEEAVPNQAMMDMPGMADEMRRPMMLLVRAVK